MDVDFIVSTTIPTINKLKQNAEYGPDALMLYFDYVGHSRIQKTNQVWCTNEFMMKSLGWGEKRLLNAKGLLKELGLIEQVQTRTESGKLGKTYTKINFLITTTPPNHGLESPSPGEGGTNALSTLNKMLEEEKEMLEEVSDKFSSLPDKEINYQLTYQGKNIGDYISLFVKEKIITQEYGSKLKINILDLEEHIIQQSLTYLSGFKKELTEEMPDDFLTDEEYLAKHTFGRTWNHAKQKLYYNDCEDWMGEIQKQKQEWLSKQQGVGYKGTSLVFELLERMLGWFPDNKRQIKNFKSTYTDWAKRQTKDFKK